MKKQFLIFTLFFTSLAGFSAERRTYTFRVIAVDGCWTMYRCDMRYKYPICSRNTVTPWEWTCSPWA